MDVEIISIGDEILSGSTVNTNAAFLSSHLTQKGYSVRRHTVIADHIDAIREVFHSASKRAKLIIATGGLGPTLDDVTKEAAAPLFSKQPQELKNSIGTAPGAFGDGLILLPGVPREMERMFLEEAIPLIEEHFPLKKKQQIRRCTLCLLRELEVDPVLRKIQTPGLEIGIYPSYGTVEVVFKSIEPVDSYIQKVKDHFPTFFIGEGKIEQAIHREFISRKETLSLAESCTGGSIAQRLTAIPGASHFFSGAIVAYSNQWKERFLGVRHDTLSKKGAVSTETVEEMIQGLFDESEANYAVAVSGTLGPDGGSSQKPVGTLYIAIGKRGDKTDVGRLKAPADRKGGIEFAVQTALGALWRRIAHNTATFS